jgi:hypothetical protein
MSNDEGISASEILNLAVCRSLAATLWAPVLLMSVIALCPPPAVASELVAVAARAYATTYAKTPFCTESAHDDAEFNIHFHSSGAAGDEKFAVAAARAALQLRDYWPGKNFCGFAGVGSDDFRVSFDTFYGGKQVGSGSFDIYDRSGPENIQYEFDTSSFENSVFGALADRIYAGEFTDGDRSWDFKRIIALLSEIEPSISAEERAPYYLTTGQFHKYQYNRDLRDDKVERPAGADLFYAGPDAERYFEMASDLGHPIGTLELARSRGLFEALHRISYNAGQGIDPIFTPEVHASFERNGWLYTLGLAQRVGHFSAYEAEFANRGVVVSEHHLGLDPDAPPNPSMIENLLNARYCDALNAGNAVATFGNPELAALADSASTCDGQWVTLMQGLTQYRFAVRDRPDCTAVETGVVECGFTAKVVYHVNIGGTEAHANLAGLFTGDQEKLPGQARFVRDGEQWRIGDYLNLNGTEF